MRTVAVAALLLLPLIATAKKSAPKAGDDGGTDRMMAEIDAASGEAMATQSAEMAHKERIAKAIASVPAGRVGEPEDIAHAVSFLASPGASYVTGEHLLVAGGRTIH